MTVKNISTAFGAVVALVLIVYGAFMLVNLSNKVDDMQDKRKAEWQQIEAQIDGNYTGGAREDGSRQLVKG